MTSTISARLAALKWQPDRLVLDGWQFLLQHRHAAALHSPGHFMFYKLESMMQQYEDLFRAHPSLTVRTMLELGMWDGGSLALWTHILEPQLAIGVDLSDSGDGPYFSRFVEARDLGSRVETHWGVDQSDASRLRAIVGDRASTLDLIIDDASHLYAPTLASFEALFPLLQPGGLYVVEDWAWEHWPEFSGRDAIWRFERPLGDFVRDLVRFCATGPVASVKVYKDFVAVEKAGEVAVPFRLADHIVTRQVPRRSFVEQTQRVGRRVRRALRPR